QARGLRARPCVASGNGVNLAAAHDPRRTARSSRGTRPGLEGEAQARAGAHAVHIHALLDEKAGVRIAHVTFDGRTVPVTLGDEPRAVAHRQPDAAEDLVAGAVVVRLVFDAGLEIADLHVQELPASRRADVRIDAD